MSNVLVMLCWYYDYFLNITYKMVEFVYYVMLALNSFWARPQNARTERLILYILYKI